MAHSVYNDQNVLVTKHVNPYGVNLTNLSTRTLAPSQGALAYDIGTNLLYLGTNSNAWQLISSGATSNSLALGTIGSTPNANGASLLNTTGMTTLTLQPANNAFGGVMSTGTQGFAGVKTFGDGITLGAYSTTFDTYTRNTVAMNWTGAAGSNAANVFYERIGNQIFVTLPKVYAAKAVAGAGASIDISGTIPPQFIPATDTYGSLDVYSSVSPFAASNQEFSLGVFKINATTGLINIGSSIMTTDNTFVLFQNAGSGAYNGHPMQTFSYHFS